MYIRVIDICGLIRVSFVMGKSRVAPLKSTTVPRLELTAAVTSVQLGSSVRRDLDVDAEVFFYTDSTTVLRYIYNVKNRYPIFVANRVRMIREYSEQSQWRYIQTSKNPADDASRGMTAGAIVTNKRWLTGPEFLLSTEIPDFVKPLDEVVNEHNEHSLSVLCNEDKDNDNDDVTTRLLGRFSSWFRLKRAVAVLQRYFAFLYDNAYTKTHITCKRHHARQFSVNDMQEAENAIIRYTQQVAFPVEKIELQKIKDGRIGTLKKGSRLYKLNPFIDSFGLLRVGGRMRRSSLAESVRHPLILPKKCHVTRLVVCHTHEQLAHAGRDHVIARLRETFWIINCNATVRHVLNKCVICRKLRGPTGGQMMADLPAARTEPSSPFSHVGVDYFGPFLVKDGRKELKRYGVIFTCMASRAVHIETANSLETSSFLNALRRFIARRGTVLHLYSDNGTNFIGAHKELKDALLEIDHDVVQNHLLKRNIGWSFNPPGASHMGGVWERLIRTIRKTLNPLLIDHGTRLTDELLRTFLCEVEAIINSRPLTNVANEVDGLDAITPNHLLTTKAVATLAPPGKFESADLYTRRAWRRVQYLTDLFWTRWKKEYLVTLQQRNKWQKSVRNYEVGDVVLLSDETTPRNSWPLAIVQEIEKDRDGVVRAVKVRTSSRTLLRRPVHKTVLLVSQDV